MNIESGLEKRQQELVEIQKDIAAIENEAAVLKDSVKKYNELKQRSSELKKIQKQKERDLKIVVEFFKNTEEHYLDKVFPLFRDNQEENRREEVAG
jgi:hypothetical protein